MKAKYLLEQADKLAETAGKALGEGPRQAVLIREAGNLARRIRMQYPVLKTASPAQRKKLEAANRLAVLIGNGWEPGQIALFLENDK
jgi:hypothetical protein